MFKNFVRSFLAVIGCSSVRLRSNRELKLLLVCMIPLLFSCKSLYLFTDVDPHSCITIGGIGHGAFSADIVNKSINIIEIQKISSKKIDLITLIPHRKMKVSVDAGISVRMKNNFNSAIPIKVTVTTQDKLVFTSRGDCN